MQWSWKVVLSSIKREVMRGTNPKYEKTRLKKHIFRLYGSTMDLKNGNLNVASTKNTYQISTSYSICKGDKRGTTLFKVKKGNLICPLLIDPRSWFSDILCHFEFSVDRPKKEQFLRFLLFSMPSLQIGTWVNSIPRSSPLIYT